MGEVRETHCLGQGSVRELAAFVQMGTGSIVRVTVGELREEKDKSGEGANWVRKSMREGKIDSG